MQSFIHYQELENIKKKKKSTILAPQNYFLPKS